jgi:hypothetical protein
MDSFQSHSNNIIFTNLKHVSTLIFIFSDIQLKISVKLDLKFHKIIRYDPLHFNSNFLKPNFHNLMTLNNYDYD